jgi:hypothetical protein
MAEKKQPSSCRKIVAVESAARNQRMKRQLDRRKREPGDRKDGKTGPRAVQFLGDAFPNRDPASRPVTMRLVIDLSASFFAHKIGSIESTDYSPIERSRYCLSAESTSL